MYFINIYYKNISVSRDSERQRLGHQAAVTNVHRVVQRRPF